MILSKRGLTAVLFGKRPEPKQEADDHLTDMMVRAEVQNLQANVERSSASARLNDTLSELLDFQQQGKGSAASATSR